MDGWGGGGGWGECSKGQQTPSEKPRGGSRDEYSSLLYWLSPSGPVTSRNSLHFPEFAAGDRHFLMVLQSSSACFFVSSSPHLMCFDSHSVSKAAEIMTFLCDAGAHQAYHCWLVHSPLKLPPSFKKYFLLLTHRCNDWQAVNSPRGEFAYRATSLTTSKVVGF